MSRHKPKGQRGRPISVWLQDSDFHRIDTLTEYLWYHPDLAGADLRLSVPKASQIIRAALCAAKPNRALLDGYIEVLMTDGRRKVD